jgi:membrane-associated phospholipid phosphatase
MNGKGLFFVLSALVLSVLLTTLFIYTGIDWSYATYFSQRPIAVYFSLPFVLAGMIFPLALILSFQFRKMRVHAKIALFSFLSSYILSTTLKIVTNRIDMEPLEPIGDIDFSNGFRFGFFNSLSLWESISEGWPSGHTLVAITMAISLSPLISSRKWQIMNQIYCIVVALSVSTAFHWLSDVVSGAIIGGALGYFLQLKFNKVYEQYYRRSNHQ